MKNILILGFVSLLLFAVAFGLSVTLQQTKPTAKDEDKDKDKDKKGLKDDKEKPSAKDEKKKEPSAETPKVTKDDTPVAMAAEQKARDEELKRRAERQSKREAQQAIILKDLREMRDEEDRVAKLIAAEVKLEKARDDSATPPTTPPVPNPKKGSTPTQPGTPFASAQPDANAKAPDPAEKKQLERLAVIYEAMPPETAAKLFQEQADSGKLDTVVKVMGYMRERASGKVISEIPDRALAAQIMDRMLLQKKPAPTPPNSPTN